MKFHLSKLAIRLTFWYLLLSVFPILVLIFFIQSNISSLMLNDFRQNLNASLHYVAQSFEGMPIEQIDPEIIPSLFGKEAQFFIINEDLVYLANSQSEKVGNTLAQDFSAEDVSSILSVNDECRLFNQSKDIFCIETIPNSTNKLVIKNNLSDFFARINALHQKSIVQIIISLLIMTTFGGFIIWLIVGKSIQQLTAATSRMMTGDFSTPIDIEMMTDEFSILGEAFNNMTHQIDALLLNQTEKINELNLVKSALEKSQDNLRTFFHSMNDFIFVINQKEEMIYGNHLIERQLGYTLDEILGKSIHTIFIQNYPNREDSPFLSESHQLGTIEGYLLGKDGEIIETEMKLSTGQWNDQQVVFGTARDVSERINSEKEIRKQIQRLESLHKIELAISGTLDLNITMKVLLRQVNKHLNTQGSAVLLYDSVTNQLSYFADEGFSSSMFQNYSMHIGDGLAGKAAIERNLLTTHEAFFESNSEIYPPFLQGLHFKTVYDIPLIAKGELKGILELYSNQVHVEDKDWQNFLNALATQAALAIENTQLVNDLQKTNIELYLAYDLTLEGWAQTLELRNLESHQHSERTLDLMMNFVRQFNFRDAMLPHIRRGTLLHDIGKLGIPDQILNKPGPLSEKEWEIVKQHPLIAYNLLEKIPFLRPALNIPYFHHERWDGKGYPSGISEEQIPLEARIFSVIDVWDALLHDCSYRKAWNKQDAINYLKEKAGSQFDPFVVDKFIEFIAQYENN